MIKKIGFTTIWFLILSQVNLITIGICLILFSITTISTKELIKLNQFNTNKRELTYCWLIKCANYACWMQLGVKILNGIAKNIK